MKLAERQKQAAAMHAAGGNCAQSVAYALRDLVKGELDETALFKVTEGFGLGMGGMDGTCGALAGAVVIAGLINSSGSPKPSSKGQTYQLAKELLRRFQEAHGAVRCRDLKGVDTGKVLCSCPLCIDDAIRIACDVFGVEDR